MIVWPVSLPPMPYSSYRTEVVNAVDDGDNDLYQERKRTYPDHVGDFTFKMCPSHMPILKTFYDTTLNQNNPFSAPWLITAGFPNHCMVMDRPPKMVFKITWWEVSISVRIIHLVPRDNGAITYGEA